MQRILIAVIGVLVVATSIAPTTGTSASGTERNGLTDLERDTLWSRDADTDSAMGRATGGSKLAPVANATDISFQRPPRTAATWTRHDFADYTPGDKSTSIVPSTTTPADSWAIKDGHVTIFGTLPSTIAHLDPSTTRRYAAPNGTLLAAIDYRINPPVNRSREIQSESWSVQDHDVSEIHLVADGETLAEASETRTPRLSYQLAGRGQRTLTVTAEINVRLEHTVTTHRNETTTSIETDTLTVRDQLPVTIYDPTITARRARYPNGSYAVAVTADQPWQGIRMESSGGDVRTTWRYYTARDTGWDDLVHYTANQTYSVESPARPVQIHAYPSRRGTRASPGNPELAITDTWGASRSSPNATIGGNVNVDVVHTSYIETRGIVLRTPGTDVDTLEARGIINGSRYTVDETKPVQRVQASELTVTVQDERSGTAALRIHLQERATGDPISLSDESRRTISPDRNDAASGYISVAGRRVQTNESGIAMVRVRRPGVYPVRYHPGAWHAHDPAYVADSDVARWHPLTTVTGWVVFASEALIGLLPVVGALYVGRALGRILSGHEQRGRQP